ncbi:hypothetical protein OC25_03920 [Pedobacter kyungheensis]|uniref:Uncharacterized protein n=1 Tax=Pedobacter kyungheensis TaxID=1069985 RepID=A0A0C1FWK3_9SPHI|nr:hypothetical protein OC25_03920 [Pedobacter kyungheensis]
MQNTEPDRPVLNIEKPLIVVAFFMPLSSSSIINQKRQINSGPYNGLYSFSEIRTEARELEDFEYIVISYVIGSDAASGMGEKCLCFSGKGLSSFITVR